MQEKRRLAFEGGGGEKIFFLAHNIKETEHHIEFLDKFGDYYRFHKSRLLEDQPEGQL